MKRGIEANNYIPYIGAKKKTDVTFLHIQHIFFEKVPVLGLPPRGKIQIPLLAHYLTPHPTPGLQPFFRASDWHELFSGK